MPIKKEKEMERYIYQNMKGQGEKNKLSTRMLIKKEKEMERYVLFLFLFLDKMEQYGFWKGKKINCQLLGVQNVQLMQFEVYFN